MTITKIGPLKQNRRTVYVDGELYERFHPDTLIEFSLTEGTVTDPDRLEEALSHSRELLARQKALRLLSTRSYTSRRLEDKLSVEGGDAARAAVRHMEDLGLVNDDDYARRCAEQLYVERYYAPKRISQALRQRGIPADIASEVSGLFDREDNDERAAEYIARKYPNLDDEGTKRRAWAALQRLGYTSGEAKRALEIAGSREDDD